MLIFSTDAFNEVICIYLLDKNYNDLDYAEIYASYLDSPEFHADKVYTLDGKKLYLHRPTKSLMDSVYLNIGHC